MLLALNRDTVEFGLNSLYDNLLKSGRVKFISPNAINLCPSVSSIHANESDPERSKRLTSVFALERIRLLNNMWLFYFIYKFVFVCLFSITTYDGHCICDRNI